MLRSIHLPLYKPRKLPRKLVVKMCTYNVDNAVFKYTSKQKYDFERERVQIEKISDLYFYKNKEKIIVSVSRSQDPQYELMFIAEIDEDESMINFKIKNQVIQRRNAEESDSESEEDKIPLPYLVVRSEKELVKSGMKIKLGLTKLHIKEIFVGQKLKEVKKEEMKNNEELALSNQEKLFYEQKENAGPQDQCRICYEKETQDNLLLSLCKCSGDTKWIHMQCLSFWINKIFKKKNHGFFEEKNYQDLLCDICKIPYSQYVQVKDKIYLLLTKTTQANITFVHRFSPEKKSFDQQMMFGKDKNSWYPIKFDPKVSNKHAQIKYQKQKKKVWISDLGSDYGTLIHHKNMEFSLLKEKENIQRIIQYGNIIFVFELHNN